MMEFFLGLYARVLGITGIRALLLYTFTIFCVFIAWLILTFGVAR